MAVTGRTRDMAIDAILRECNRQDAKWGKQNHSMEWWLLILGEEFGELCQAVLQFRFGGPYGHVQKIKLEMVQVAAVAMAMIECLERNGLKCLSSPSPAAREEESMEKDYTIGQQPCDSPRFEEREWFGLVEHECIYCSDRGKEGTLMLCSNCNRDHHKYGWNRCAGRKEKESAAKAKE